MERGRHQRLPRHIDFESLEEAILKFQWEFESVEGARLEPEVFEADMPGPDCDFQRTSIDSLHLQFRKNRIRNLI